MKHHEKEKMSCSASKGAKGMKKEEHHKEKKKKKQMDKKIKKLEKGTSKLLKQEKSLMKADHKRDKFCELGKKVMNKKKK